MPIYEYICSSCGAQLEKFQKISDDPIKTCPSCGKEKLEKKISRAGFQLKGEGWYVTDFRDKDKKKDKPKTDTKAEPKKESAKTTEKTNKSDKTKSEKKTEK